MNQTLIREIAKMIDHSLLHPTMTDTELHAGCLLALKYDVASVCVKPYAVAMAQELLAGSDVLVGTVIGFPAGNSAISIKVAETEQACRDGAVEIDMVVNIGKVLGENWSYVTDEIRAVNEATVAHGAILKVIFENDYLPQDSYKIRLCELCTEVGAAFVKTSTGYGFVKGADGKYSYEGATEHDLRLMLDHVGPGVRVKAAGGVRTLDGLLKVKEMGVSRLGASATATIMEDAYRRFGAVAADAPVIPVADANGY
ncbi:deoxyribose-phosphate aldolase [Spirosoma montaniterrae]|uniref:Deoxyribose-phosphate aldolase n=1 Tax=Spirosoma montaniterrae TaxID=1178516 RepID=A0A1P9X2Y0_9BACT|nr:deoxyribose-phosphate aldolase [Spirosoma montaniterrae]AQG81992.1 2-deoxyribose-5-phosphate aldolase [Spirosoma montaniterrae]